MTNNPTIQIEKKSARDGSGYHVYSTDGLSESLLFDGLDNTIEIKGFSVDEKSRGKGLG